MESSVDISDLASNTSHVSAGRTSSLQNQLFKAPAKGARHRAIVVRLVLASITVAFALMLLVPSVSQAADVINLNKADMAALQTLPGIGEKRAKAIIDYRKKNGGFSDKKDLMNVPGIGENILQKISRNVSVTGGAAKVSGKAKTSDSKAKSDSKTDKKSEKKKTSGASDNKKTDKKADKKSEKKTDKKSEKKADARKAEKKTDKKKSEKKKSGKKKSDSKKSDDSKKKKKK